MQPRISIVLPIYNAQTTLKETLESILSQDYECFEVIAIIDGASDESKSIVESIKDPRVRIIDNIENKGLIYSLNLGFREAKGEFIARMDADDIMEISRLSTQLKFMETHPDIDICGCNIRIFDGSKIIGKQVFGNSCDEILAEMIFNSPIAHPTYFVRSSSFKSFSYSEKFKFCEDYDLLSRFLLSNHKAANISSFLLMYRISNYSQTSIGELDSDNRYKAISKIQSYVLKKGLGLTLDDMSLRLHYMLSLTSRIKELSLSENTIEEIKHHFDRLLKANKKFKYCKDSALRSSIGKVWLKILRYRLIDNRKFIHYILCKYTFFGIIPLIKRFRNI